LFYYKKLTGVVSMEAKASIYIRCAFRVFHGFKIWDIVVLCPQDHEKMRLLNPPLGPRWNTYLNMQTEKKKKEAGDCRKSRHLMDGNCCERDGARPRRGEGRWGAPWLGTRLETTRL
jgi:hypothetical protein